MRLVGMFVLVSMLGAPQDRHPGDKKDEDVLLPSGKSQRLEILKADYEKSKAEAAELVDLAEQLKEEIEKNEAFVLNLRTVKKAEEIEKLAKRIKDRMRRY